MIVQKHTLIGTILSKCKTTGFSRHSFALIIVAVIFLGGPPMFAAGSKLSQTQVIPAGFHDHFAEVNGVRLHYVEGGKGPELILLHGYPQTWYGWRKVMRLLANRYHMIVPDLRGLGESERPKDGDYTKKSVAADVYALAQQLGIIQAFVAGQDMGGPVGYALAADHPDFVRKLALIDTGVPGFGLEAAMNPAAGGSWHFGFFAVPRFPEMLTRGREKTFLTAFAFRSPYVFRQESVTDADIDHYLASYSNPDGMAAGFGYYRAFAQDAKDNQARANSRLTIPVLAVGGDHGLGGMTLENARRLADDAHGVIIPGCGHFVYDEKPEPLAQELETFFGR